MNQVANTILTQLGGRSALAMLGAGHILTDKDRVHIHIGSNPNKVSILVIRLDPSDTYTVQFWRGKGIHCKMMSEVSDVYRDSLRRVVETGTGFYVNF